MTTRRSFLAASLLPGLPSARSAGPGAAPPEPLQVVGSADPPFRSFGPEGAGGMYFELMNEAARRLGWTVVYREVPSARALRMMEAGEADVMLGPLRNADRERYLSYSRTVLPAEDKAFYTRPGAPPIRRLDDLVGRRIAVHRGKRYGGAFDEDPRLQRTEVNEYRIALEMVARQRLDVAVLPERQGDLLLSMLGLALLKQPLSLPGEPPFVVFSRRSPWLDRQATLDRAFQSMHEDGSWRRIVQRY
jgi:polar amino acid transport system substrate-binding protein